MNMASPVTAGIEAAPIDLHAFVRELFPFCRSISGDGVRQTLARIREVVPIDVIEVASGTPVLDWVVPDEWNIRAAAIRRLNGETLVDFADCNLHVMSYSKPVHAQLSREALAQHIHTLPDQPDIIPYRTGYFADSWGFCLSDRQWSEMTDAEYRVEIDSSLAAGHLTYGELFLPGSTPDEILISVHICHPSLANDNLSGIAVAAALAMREAGRAARRLGIRFLFVPATIGAITWLALNEAQTANVRHGLVLTCLGDDGAFHYKQSRNGATIDRAVAHVLRLSGAPHEILPFSPYGYDERQYCSPGFDMPLGCLMRSVHGTFPQYHTSDDNLEFVGQSALEESYRIVSGVLDLLETDRVYVRIDGRGEPQLGRRGLYRAIAGQHGAGGAGQMDLLWFLNLADGRHSLLDMAERADTPFDRLAKAACLSLKAGLVEVVT